MEPIIFPLKLARHNSFAELVRTCYMERINLSANRFYITPDIDFDPKTGKGNPYSYYTYEAAFSEVEIDTLTGDFHTRISDIILDLGCSLNPAIDIGQGVPNAKAIHSSKAVGEPPLFLTSSVFLDAIIAMSNFLLRYNS